ncbi:hypothetical protein LIER_23534 [Lithospermum erythrorhizon]|uniref:Reverse transcriptase RNase H-like domain-containing protein n=1 Tax=Lithospermum erythrorhizon TaxID=34254 RepID=A0AAV3QXY2_LITER
MEEARRWSPNPKWRSALDKIRVPDKGYFRADLLRGSAFSLLQGDPNKKKESVNKSFNRGRSESPDSPPSITKRVNVILGGASRRRLRMKFPSQYETGEIRGSQKKARGFYLASTKRNKAQIKEGSSSKKSDQPRDQNKGIEPIPDKIAVVQAMQSPKTMKEAHQLTGRIATLTRFISRAVVPGAQEVPPIPSVFGPASDVLQLYLAVSESAISSILLREEAKIQGPVYYVSKIITRGAKTMYPQTEKLVYALIVAARKFKPYFEAHLGDFKIDETKKRLVGYLRTVQKLAKLFRSYHMEHVSMKRNNEADRLSQLVMAGYETLPEATVVEWIKEEAFQTKEVMSNDVPEGGSSVPWYQDFLDFLKTGVLAGDLPMANKIQRQIMRYTLMDGVLYQRLFQGPMLSRVTRNVGLMALEEVHVGMCGRHINA